MKSGFVRFIAATVVYSGFAVYLYRPYFEQFDAVKYLFVVSACAASAGCFLLSRRWVSSFWASLFAGAIYGFGPFLLGFARFHPTASFLAASIPWLFCPAAFLTRDKRRWVGLPLSALPFLAILFFFQVSVHYRLFAISTQTRLSLPDLAGLLSPLIASRRGIGSGNLIGFYHVPIAPLVMGLSMLLAARRSGTIAVFVIGTILACCPSFLEISPIIWLTFPILCCSVLVGVGLQGLACAASKDRSWLLAVTAISGVLLLATLLPASKFFQIFAGLEKDSTRAFATAAQMYLLGVVACGIILFMARAKLRLGWLRLAILCSAIAVDIFVGASSILERFFQGPNVISF
ncbi:MAG: hypothetical protein ACYTBJ_04630 [Planctomycetota bacterium]